MKSDKHRKETSTKQHKQHLKKSKHFITKPKHTKFSNRPTHKTNLKLFSLQHQTLNLLRKVNKLKINRSKSLSTDSIEKNVDSNKSTSKLSSNNNNNAINKQKILEDVRPIIGASENNDIDNKKSHVDKKLSKKKHLRLMENKFNESYNESTDMIIKEIESQYASDSSDDTCTGTEMKINIQEQRKRKLKIKKQLKAKSFANNEDDCEENEINEVESVDTNENLVDEQHVSNISEPESLVFESTSNIDFFQFNKTQVLLTLVHPCSLYLMGILEVEVFFGTVDVLGYKLDRNCGKNTLYSLKGSSYLCLTTKENNQKLDSENFSVKELLKYDIPRDKVKDISSKYSDNSVILILNKCESNTYSSLWTKFIEKYSGIILLPHIDEKKSANPIEKILDCEFKLFTDSILFSKLYCEMPQWKEIAEVVKTDLGRTMICGGKGVGKSTFLRYLINHSLPVWKKILVIDLDPGQSEFMAPGLLSAFIITSPLLGPSFTHLLDPIKSLYFGITDVGQNLKKYFVYVQHVLDYCNQQDELKEIPWLINTMGFNQGIGVLVTSSVIKKMAPSILVQIDSEHKGKNFPDALTSEFVNSNILDLSRTVTDTENLKYRLFNIQSAVRNRNRNPKKAQEMQTWGLSPSSGRDIMILAYFGQMLNSDVTDIFQVKPYVVDISNLFIEVINENLVGDDLLDAINGSLVALCFKVDVQDRSNFCHGFGIVRAVDKVRRKLFLLTPLKEDKLHQVNSLVKGVITLPNKLYSDPSDSISGQVPYVSISKNILSCTVMNTYKKSRNIIQQE